MAMFSLAVAMHNWCCYCLDNAPCMYKNRGNELLSDDSGGICEYALEKVAVLDVLGQFLYLENKEIQ